MLSEEQVKNVEKGLEANLHWVELGFMRCKQTMSFLMHENLDKEINSATNFEANKRAILQTLLQSAESIQQNEHPVDSSVECPGEDENEVTSKECVPNIQNVATGAKPKPSKEK